MPANRIPAPDAMCDGGDLDCGSGLLLIIRNAMTPVLPGGVRRFAAGRLRSIKTCLRGVVW